MGRKDVRACNTLASQPVALTQNVVVGGLVARLDFRFLERALFRLQSGNLGVQGINELAFFFAILVPLGHDRAIELSDVPAPTRDFHKERQATFEVSQGAAEKEQAPCKEPRLRNYPRACVMHRATRATSTSTRLVAVLTLARESEPATTLVLASSAIWRKASELSAAFVFAASTNTWMAELFCRPQKQMRISNGNARVSEIMDALLAIIEAIAGHYF